MQNSDMQSRRQVLTAAAAATVTLPMLQAAIGGTKTAAAATASAPAAAPATPPARPGPAAAEKPGWFATTLKPADVKDGEFTAVKGHSILLARVGKDITALTSKCSHMGCDLAPTVKPGEKTVVCGCHRSAFNLDGTVAAAPARTPLAHYGIRLAAEGGLIEVDPGTTPAKDAKEFSVAAT